MSVKSSGRAAQAEAVLRELGLPEGRVSALGPSGEIASVRAPAAEWQRLLDEERGAEVAARIKALGFRFVALDLEPESDA